MTRILSVATAGLRADQLADKDHLRFPRVDYIELQRLLNTSIMDYSAYDQNYAGHFFRRLETHLRSDFYLATLSWWNSRDYSTVFTWSERAGIPLAGYKRFTRLNKRFVTMFQCWSKRQEIAITKLGLFSAMDDIIVHCASMKDNLIRLGAPAEKINLIHYSIDQSFYSPLHGIKPQNNLIMSLGEPRSRDYAALFQAVEGLPVNLKVAASGHWYAREKTNHLKSPAVENITIIKNLPQWELKKLYASAQFVVLPIQDLVYSAGATVALEAGSMARAVIAFRSRGIVDYIIDGETGILVDPGDVIALREAIQFLLANPKEAMRLGQNARQRVVEELNLESYVRNIAKLLMNNFSQLHNTDAHKYSP